MTRASILLIFISLTFATTAQADLRQEAVEKGDLGMEELVSFAKQKVRNDKEICLFFYYWTAYNLTYDLAVHSGPYLGEENDPDLPENVMKTRRAVCSGYSALYQEFLSRCGIECKFISGTSKGLENVLHGEPYEEDHSWNAFRLGGKWYLTDVTWAGTTMLDKYVDDFYFMTDPAIFVLDHYPSDPYWQLLDEPVSFEQFIAFPYFTKKYFLLDFGDYIQQIVKKPVYGNYFLTIGLSDQWKPKPVIIDRHDRDKSEPDFEVSADKQRKRQTLKVKARSGIIRLDACLTDKYSITTELGLAYFNLEL
jgi:hypothetical protein